MLEFENITSVLNLIDQSKVQKYYLIKSSETFIQKFLIHNLTWVH